MKYILSAMLLAGAAFIAVAPAAAQFVNPEVVAHQKRIDELKKRHALLKPMTPEQKTKHADFLKRFDAHVADLVKADKIAVAETRKKETDRIGVEITKTEKDFADFEATFKGAMRKHARHDAFIARLKDLRARHGALKPTKPEDVSKHADFLKRFETHEAEIEKAAKIEAKEDRRKAFDAIDKAIAATEKEFAAFEKHLHGA